MKFNPSLSEKYLLHKKVVLNNGISYLLTKFKLMKLSSTLLQAITLGVSVAAVSAATVSCEKQDIRKKKEQVNEDRTGNTNSTGTHCEPCPACGMG